MNMGSDKRFIVGAGYIGKKIARQLQQQGLSAACLVQSDVSAMACESLCEKVVRIDLDEAPAQFTEPCDFDGSSLVYLVPPPPRGPLDTRMSHFIESLEQQQARVDKVVLISTTGVYGDCHGEWIDETHEVAPQVDRARRRLDAEQQLSAYCERHGTRLVIFRVPGIYGDDKLPVKRITSGEPIVRAEDSGYTNRIHAQDLAAFCVEALVEDVEPGIYNASDGHPSTMNDYFMRVADALGLERPREITLQEAQQTLSAGMLSYLAESKRISNSKLLEHFRTPFNYPDLAAGLKNISVENKSKEDERD